MNIIQDLGQGIKNAINNPFGIDFEIHQKKIYIPLSSAFNLLGYVDCLERIIGVTRVALALVKLALSTDKQERLIAAGHVFRGILEMMGSFELYLLILDTAFTVINVAKNTFVAFRTKSAQVSA